MALAGFNNYLQLTIDSSKVDEDLTNFPVNITLSSGTGQTGFDATDVFDELTTSGIDSYTKFALHADDVLLSDSSEYNHPTTLTGNVTRSSTQSKFGGYSAYFDGDGDFITAPTSSDWDFGTGDFTIDCWFYLSVIDKFNVLINQADDAVNGWLVDINTTNYPRLVAHIGGSWGVFMTSDTAVSVDTWNHIAVVRNGSSFSLYLNGNLVDSVVDSDSILSSSELLQIGHFQTAALDHRYLSGYIDELRISKGIARWTSSFTPPEYPYESNWLNRKKIAITDANDNQLYTEIEHWDYVNEEANLWVNVPTIVSGTDTTLYLYYDATASGNTTYVGDTGEASAQLVWDDNFKGVWHMAQDPSGGSDAILDSTANLNHGTSVGSMLEEDLVDGKIGKGIDFDGIDDEVDLGTHSSLDLTSAFTYEAIFKTSYSALAQDIITKFNENGLDYQMELHLNTVGSLASNIYNGVLTGVNCNTINGLGGNFIDGTYHYVATNIDISGDGNSRLFTDGVLNVTSSTSLTDINSLAATPTNIGERYNAAADKHMNGTLDEIRVSNIKRSDTWIKATYYSNWNDLVTFAPPVDIITFIFSDPTPTPLTTVYGVAHQLQLTTTVTGSDPSYVYDAVFYDASDDSQIGQTIFGTDSGQYVATTMTTVSATNYSWYVTATSSGQSDTSSTYVFSNRFLCSGHTQVAGTGASGIPVRLYRRSTGVYIGGAISSGVSGTFNIPTDYNEYHYAVALYTSSGTNALIADWLKPSN